jgi:Uma2 family endonuclease
MVEVKSQECTLKSLRDKIKDFLSLGTQVGILINPENQTVKIYRLAQDVVILRDGDVLTVPDLFPGFEVVIAELWSPEFD